MHPPKLPLSHHIVAIRAGRVALLLGSADALPRFEERFDKILAVNVYMFWDDPASVLTSLRRLMKPGGVIARSKRS